MLLITNEANKPTGPSYKKQSLLLPEHEGIDIFTCNAAKPNWLATLNAILKITFCYLV